MPEAVFGLVGVIVGGLLNGGVSFLADRRQQRASAKIAARLLISDIELSEQALVSAVNQKIWTGLKVTLSTSLWDEHRLVMAAVLTSTDWEAVSRYYTSLSVLNEMTKLVDMGAEIEESQLGNIARLAIESTQAEKAIRRAAGLKSRKQASGKLPDRVRWRYLWRGRRL